MVSSGYQVAFALMQNFQPDYLKLIHLEITNQMMSDVIRDMYVQIYAVF